MTENGRSPNLDRETIARTATLIGSHVRRTPVIEADLADFGGPAHPILFKLENLQHSGSFKARGAFAHLLGRSVPPAGVVAASGGNHGAAVAYAAGKLGRRATIFVPAGTGAAKAARIRAYGAELRAIGADYDAALAASRRFAEETGALPIHAYDDPHTLLGQGTLGREIEADSPGLDTLLVAVGGGGLIGGIAAWLGGRMRLIAVEPEGAPTLQRALAAGEPVDAPTGSIAADSLAPRRIGTLMFPLAQAHVADSLLVGDEEIRAAQRALWEGLRQAVEPGGATAFAALHSGRYRPAPGERVMVLVCGANTGGVTFG